MAACIAWTLGSVASLALHPRLHVHRPLPTSASSGGGDSGDVAARVKELEGALADTRRQHQTELEALQGERLAAYSH